MSHYRRRIRQGVGRAYRMTNALWVWLCEYRPEISKLLTRTPGPFPIFRLIYDPWSDEYALLVPGYRWTQSEEFDVFDLDSPQAYISLDEHPDRLTTGDHPF